MYISGWSSGVFIPQTADELAESLEEALKYVE
jgi:hypothetical protein